MAARIASFSCRTVDPSRSAQGTADGCYNRAISEGGALCRNGLTDKGESSRRNLERDTATAVRSRPGDSGSEVSKVTSPAHLAGSILGRINRLGDIYRQVDGGYSKDPRDQASEAVSETPEAPAHSAAGTPGCRW